MSIFGRIFHFLKDGHPLLMKISRCNDSCRLSERTVDRNPQGNTSLTYINAICKVLS